MFFKRVNGRIKIVLLIFLLLFVFIILRVFYVQVFDYKKLSSLANGLWSRELPIQADRGLVLDRNGIVLADNITTTSLVLIPNQIKDKDKTAEVLADILNVSKKEMARHINKKTSIERVHPEGRRLRTVSRLPHRGPRGLLEVQPRPPGRSGEDPRPHREDRQEHGHHHRNPLREDLPHGHRQHPEGEGQGQDQDQEDRGHDHGQGGDHHPPPGRRVPG